MDNDKSSIEILKEFARRSNRKVECSENSYPDVHPVTYHRRTLYIPDNEFENTWFVCFHDSKEFGEYKLFSGVFIAVDVPESTVAKVRKKDFLDKLSLKLRKQSYITGSNFDTKAVILGNDPGKIKRIFSKSSIQQLTLEAFKIDESLIIGINEPEFDFVPALKDKSHFGIFTKREWLLDKNRIEELFGLIEKFKQHLTIEH